MPRPDIPVPELGALSKRALEYLRMKADELSRMVNGKTKPEVLADKINPLIRERDAYGRRLESGDPGYLLHWNNSDTSWTPQAVGRADTIESLKNRKPVVPGGSTGNEMLDYYSEDLENRGARSYIAEKLKALRTGSRTLDANELFIPKKTVPSLSELREILPYLEQLPLYSGGPRGGSTEAKILRQKMLDDLMLNDKLPGEQ